MTNEKILKTIKETRQLYLNEKNLAVTKLSKELSNLTSSQVQQEMIFIADMESRAYALTLLIEDLEDLIEDDIEEDEEE